MTSFHRWTVVLVTSTVTSSLAAAAHHHDVQSSPVGHVAGNPGLNSTARFDGNAAVLEANDGAWSFGLALSSYGFEDSVVTVDDPAFGACADANRLTYEWTGEVTEWWVNDARGFEHGFDVWTRPAGAAPAGERGPLVFTLDVLGSLAPELNDARTGLLLRSADGSLPLRYDGLIAVDANGVTLDAWLEVDGRTLRIAVDEAAARYPIVVDPMVHVDYLKASNTDNFDLFGWSVAVSEDTVVVGAIGEDSGATGVNGDESDNSTGSAGAAYVFVQSGGGWSQQAYLKASSVAQNDVFGVGVAISGDTIVVGASESSSTRPGAAYVYVRSGSSWIQQARLSPPGLDIGDRFGAAVAISGDTVVVGAPTSSGLGAGAAYVFVRTGGAWVQQARLTPTNPGTGDDYGSSVAADGDVIVVGAPEEDSNAIGVNGDGTNNSSINSGAAYVFARSGTSWTQEAYLKASNTGSQDLFGWSVAVSGTTVIVGAMWEDSEGNVVNGDGSNDLASGSGAAYVYERSGGIWSRQAFLKAPNSERNDEFGRSVAATGNTVVVGARGEDGGSTGVNGDISSNSINASGAAFVFARSNGSWIPQTYLKASNTGAGDEFGISIAASGDKVVVGATREDSSAVGVNADGTDNSDNSAGAAYVLSGLASPGIGELVCVGAVNSTGSEGTLTATGSRAVADNSLSLEIGCCPPNTFGLVVTTGRPPTGSVPLGDGTLCIVNQQLGRFPVIATDAAGAATQVVDLGAIPTNLGTAAPLPGDRYYFQFYHRDLGGGTVSANLTSAISVLFE